MFTYQPVLDNGLKIKFNNEYFDLEGTISEITMYGTMTTKNYEYDLQ